MVKCIVNAPCPHIADQQRQCASELVLNAEITLHHVIQFRIMFLPEGTLRIDVRSACREDPLRPSLWRYNTVVGRLQSWPVVGRLCVWQKDYIVHTKRPAEGSRPTTERVPGKTDARLEIESWYVDNGSVHRSGIELVNDGL